MAYTTIDKPEDYFNTKLYTGNGSTQSISGIGFQPDFVYFKQRTGTPSSSGSQVYDVVRGATKYLSTHATNAEATQSNGLTSFDSDGFSLGNTSRINGTENYVAWNWLAGGTASSNTDGSITSSVSANTDAGFSIVSWTGNATAGATIGHGLGVVPKVVIYKNRTDTSDWSVYTEMVGNNKKLTLNSTNASSSSTHYNSTTPTSSVFTVGSSNVTNGSSDDMIAYCFAEKKGYSKFGSYTGNGSANGTFVYTGFKPAFVMIKQTNASGEGWHILDNKRSGANGDMERLLANSSNAESNYSGNLDLLSNGFKTRINDAGVNGSGSTYIYMAFAENPFVTSTGIPTTAR